MTNEKTIRNPQSAIRNQMNALTLSAPKRMELSSIPFPKVGPAQVLVKVDAVGLCGTDFHIFDGSANYHLDEHGRQISLEEHPLVLGHEFCGVVAEVGGAVKDLCIGDRVTVDQGLNCRSYGETELCEYCVTGNTHQCIRYAEHGITGLQGALAEYITVPAINSVRIESDLPPDLAALHEPLGCIIHSCDMLIKTHARYQFDGERPIKSVLVCGAGPAGLLFTQYLRNVIGFDGLLMVTEPNPARRELAEEYGATVIDPSSEDLVAAVREYTKGERVQCLIESAGVGQLFKQMPGLLRKQATILLYGHGHHGVELGVLNNIQFIEPTFIAPTGASGGFDNDGRPTIYRRALELLNTGRIDVSKIITHRYHSLDQVPQAFALDHFGKDYIKGVVVIAD